MSYLVLARKWRPKGFEDLVGQESIIKVLKNSITQGKIAHAYVFSGPRGVGKTTTARILSKSLNCEKGPTPTPCGECDSCRMVSEGQSIDVMEIDGASNNTVNDVRDLREGVKYSPSSGRYKIYIIDEAHMLSTSAFNALLKTLEEPPPHVIFVLATTEPKKIPLTVLSRCQHLPFRRVATSMIKERLLKITKAEGITISDRALTMVARAADGSMRDSLTILDQLASFSADISDNDVSSLLETADFESLGKTASAVISGDRAEILNTVSLLAEHGTDIRSFAKDLIKFFRDLLVFKLAPDDNLFVEIGDEEIVKLKTIASGVSEEHATLIISELIKAESEIKFSTSPRIALEMALLKISYLSALKDVNAAIKALSSGSGQGTPEPARPEQPHKTLNAQSQRPMPKEISLKPPVDNDLIQDDSSTALIKPAEYTAETLLEAVVRAYEDKDPRKSAKLAKAVPEFDGKRLRLTFNSTDAELFAKPFKDNPAEAEHIATEIFGAHVAIEIHIKHQKPQEKKNLRETVMNDPVVKDALRIFDGRVVRVESAEDQQ